MGFMYTCSILYCSPLVVTLHRFCWGKTSDPCPFKDRLASRSVQFQLIVQGGSFITWDGNSHLTVVCDFDEKMRNRQQRVEQTGSNKCLHKRTHQRQTHCFFSFFYFYVSLPGFANSAPGSFISNRISKFVTNFLRHVQLQYHCMVRGMNKTTGRQICNCKQKAGGKQTGRRMFIPKKTNQLLYRNSRSSFRIWPKQTKEAMSRRGSKVKAEGYRFPGYPSQV